MGTELCHTDVPPVVKVPPGSEANIEVAKGLGYKVVDTGGNVSFELQAPVGVLPPEYHIGHTEEEAWDRSPCFSANVEDAIDALMQFGTLYRLVGDSRGATCCLSVRDRKGDVQDVFGYAEQKGPEGIALAITRALIRCFRMKSGR